jgi:putative flippase GtrA
MLKELLLRAQRMKLKIKEFPVVWIDRDETASKVNVWKDAKNMGWNLIQLRWKILPLSLQQFIKFSIVGVFNTLITLLILFILDSTIGRGQFGYPFAYGVGAINSYIWNKLITFRQKQVSKRTPIQFILFFVLALCGLFIYSYTALFFEEVVGFHYAIASIVGTISNFLIQFLISKFVVFRKYLE